MHGAERTGAGGIDHAVGAGEVELVGDPPGHDVPEQPREAVLLPRHVRLGDALGGVVGGIVGDAGLLHGPLPLRVSEPSPQGNDEFERARDAEDHRDAVAIDGART